MALPLRSIYIFEFDELVHRLKILFDEPLAESPALPHAAIVNAIKTVISSFIVPPM